MTKEKVFKMKKISIIAALIFSLVIILYPVFNFVTKTSLNKDCGGNVVVGGNSKIGGEFQLTDINLQKVNSRDLITKPSIIYFGYSYCPDVCPYDLQRNAIAVDLLLDKGQKVTPIFITIDPTRDTPDRLKEFSTFVHPKLVALTGSDEEIKTVMKLFKVFGKKAKQENTDNNNYLMDHSAFSYLVDSSGVFIDYFNRKVSPEEMAKRITCYLNL